ncbi:MAG: hypothetical protein ACRC6A_13140 [Fusobacteriaceae bacterium]
MTINVEKLSPLAKDIDKAVTSLREELEAVNYYNMRAEQATDPQLKKLLIHNRNEEIEHAAMLSEWLRRNISNFDKEFGDYLFTTGDITGVEATATGKAVSSETTKELNKDFGLGIGNLKK